MKTSTTKTPKTPDPLAIALMGDAGTGKTSLALRFPKPGVLDLDGNLDGPTAYLGRIKAPQDYVYVQPLLDKSGKPLPMDKSVRDRIFDALRELTASPAVRTIIIDSGTKLSECFVMWILAAQNAELMDVAYWKPWRAQMLKVVHEGRNAGKHFVWIIHEQPVYGPRPPKSYDPPPRIGVEMSMPTRLSEQFGFTFTDVWRAVRVGVGRSMRLELRFVSDGEACLKNSLGLVDPIPMDWTKLEPLLKGRL